MKVIVKRSDLLRLYRVFSDLFPEVNTVCLVFDSYDYILLSKIVSSLFIGNSDVRINVDDKTSISVVYQSLTTDKDVLANVLNVMEQQAILNEEGNIYANFTNALQILHLLETLLLGKQVSIQSSQHLELVMEQKLCSIHKKLGYANFESEIIISKESYLKTGVVVSVADDSGAKFVKIVSEIEPSVYIVRITKTNLKDQTKFPYGKTYCGILVRFAESDYYACDQVCLFEYYDGVKQPLFNSITNGTVALYTNLSQYKTIISSCIFKKGDCIRIDDKVYAKVEKILKITSELEGSEFVVSLLSNSYLSNQFTYQKGQLVKGILRKRLFNNSNTRLSYYSQDVYELDISLLLDEV